MSCQRCGSKVEKGWAFCPRCGFRQGGEFFEDIFSRMRKELSQMNRLFSKDIEAFDISPWFRDMEKRKIVLNPKGSGFTIKIIQSGGREPHVSVRTFGDVNKEKLKKEIEEIGVWQPEFQNGKPVPVDVPDRRMEIPKPPQERAKASQKVEGSGAAFRQEKAPAVMEEPKTSVKRTASNVIVEMELPGVKAPADITVSELDNSIEVRALAGDKLYFKILTKPPQFRLGRREFTKEKLHLEFS
jgi:hypothetical protein